MRIFNLDLSNKIFFFIKQITLSAILRSKILNSTGCYPDINMIEVTFTMQDCTFFFHIFSLLTVGVGF